LKKVVCLRSGAIQFTKEGADIYVVCLNEEDDAELTTAKIGEIGQRAIQFEGGITELGILRG
jgi:hypothetical protein